MALYLALVTGVTVWMFFQGWHIVTWHILTGPVAIGYAAGAVAIAAGCQVWKRARR